MSEKTLTTRNDFETAESEAIYSPLELRVLGSFEFRVNQEPFAVKPLVQKLLALLALNHRRLRREHVASVLWEQSAERAAKNLRTLLWRVPEVRGHSLVIRDGDDLVLNPHVILDLDTFGAKLDALEAGNSVDARDECFAVDVLPDWWDEWVAFERERFRQMRLHGLERRALLEEQSGNFSGALEFALAAVAADPLRETAHRLVIDIHTAEGNIHEAVRHYDLFCNRPTRDLGAYASTPLTNLVDSLRSLRAPSPVR